MRKTVSVSEAKNQLSAVMDWAVESGEEVVIESRGEPKVVILSYKEYQEFLVLKEQARRKEALRQLEELAARMQARNADMSAEEVEQLADEITRETIQRMEMEGKITFQS
jgi:prevent-host-death family protein